MFEHPPEVFTAWWVFSPKALHLQVSIERKGKLALGLQVSEKTSVCGFLPILYWLFLPSIWLICSAQAWQVLSPLLFL